MRMCLVGAFYGRIIRFFAMQTLMRGCNLLLVNVAVFLLFLNSWHLYSAPNVANEVQTIIKSGSRIDLQ